MPLFKFSGRPVTLAELLAANPDDPALCVWAATARPGDVFGACLCVRTPSKGRIAADRSTGLRRVQVSIDPESERKLRAAGDGELSAGIRAAARLLP